ncbi:MAG: peptidoglycan-binding protein [Chloroflexota bacterium]|nr:peptidoglycan-binding protein [Chloroflexota bacterium]
MSYMVSRSSLDRPLGETDRRSAGYVRWVQDSLNRVNGAGLTLDGRFGPQSRKAVQGFQRRRGLPADGVVGPYTEAALVAAGAPPPPGAGGSAPIVPLPIPAPTGDSPVLIGTESVPPATTLYTGITLGGERPARAMTGIFVPAGYRPVPRVDLVLYLHGHKSKFPNVSIDGYWNRAKFQHFALREATNESRKNVILAAPTLGPGSEAGWLVKPGGLDKYVDLILTVLHTHGPYRGATVNPALGSLVLACHSGGGTPMRQLALSGQRSAASIRECWGFDCLYNRGDDASWAQWAHSRPEARLFVHYLGTTAPLSKALRSQSRDQNLSNVSVTVSTASWHNGVPLTHWRQRLEGAAFLANV